jgi:hypothetical protein
MLAEHRPGSRRIEPSGPSLLPTVRNYKRAALPLTIHFHGSTCIEIENCGPPIMSIRAALETVESQLAYWREECEAARRGNDLERIARCDKFIAQCELMIAALRQAESNDLAVDGYREARAGK